MYIRDILNATRTFSWYMWISWENSDDILRQSDGIFPSSPVNHMVDWYSWQKSAKISFHTEKTQIKVPATQNILNTHITQKMDLATCTIFFDGSLHSWSMLVNGFSWHEWLDFPIIPNMRLWCISFFSDIISAYRLPSLAELCHKRILGQ